jgi:gliding motility-associated-like protein
MGNASPESDPAEISVYPNPGISFIVNDVICWNGDDGTISSTPLEGTPPYTFSWSNGNTTRNIAGLKAGNYKLILSDLYGCNLDTTITVGEPEAITISLEVVDPFCPDSYDGSITSIVTGGIPPYTLEWSTGSHDISISGLSSGNYSLSVTDANLCNSEAGTSLHNHQEFCVTIPDIITPNNDGYNDLWEIQGIQYYPDAIVEVYDRWGKRVFHSVGYEEQWDGTFNNKKLPMDSYYYVIRLNNLLDPIFGNITIIR